MATFKLAAAVLGVIAVIYFLIQKKETRAVLISVGFVLCLISLEPMKALDAFGKSMTTGALIMAICASLGFAYVMKFTTCDQHLVRLVTRPLRGVGFFLIPIAAIVTFFINIAVPSAAGCAAAVGATMIPVLIASGVRPAMAASTVFCGTFGSMLSPGLSHNAFVANMTKMSIPDVIMSHAFYTLTAGAIGVFFLTVMAFVFKDYNKDEFGSLAVGNAGSAESEEKIKFTYALMPLVPLFILIIGGTSLNKLSYFAWAKMGVAQAMLCGAILAIVVTRSSVEKITKEFFNGMGSGYAEIMGIIIAAGVFVAGLQATGAVGAVIAWLKQANEFVRWGGTMIPFFMGLVCGSGDAAAMAFNEAITPHAAELGYTQVKLGAAAALAGALGRTASPIAGAAIVCAGLAGVSPVEMAKRTALGMVVAVIFLALFML